MKTEDKITETEITYEPLTTQVLVTWKSRGSGIILIHEDMPEELIVAKIGPQVTSVKPGDLIITSGHGGIMFLKINGDMKFASIYESSIRGIITKSETVKGYDPRETATKPLA